MVREIKSAGVPARDDPYLCRFLGTKSSKHDEYGPGLMWEFKVASGEHTGQTTAKTTGVDPTPGNICGRFLASLKGEAPANGMRIDENDFIGHWYLVWIKQTDKGSFVIDRFRPAPQELVDAVKKGDVADDAGVHVDESGSFVPF